jgi:hypothetical protein
MAASQSKLDEIVVQKSSRETHPLPFTKFMMLLGLVFAAVAAAASNATTIIATPVFDSGVPTNAPVPGNYTGALRPQIHFSPPTNFMNDPNGCHRDQNGTYHLYYQCQSTLTSSHISKQSFFLLEPSKFQSSRSFIPLEE